MLPAPLLILLLPFLVMACVKGPNPPGPTNNELKATVALSANDVWAVGEMSTSKDNGPRVLIEHWDGKQWHTALPDIQGELLDISADSASDIWAVGDSGIQLLILHWDGESWRQCSFPPLAGANILHSVLALSQNDAWVVGSSRGQVLIAHWNGTSWQPLIQPFHVGYDGGLQAITGRAANDIWTVGFGAVAKEPFTALAAHWDGRSWKIVPMPTVMQDKRLLGDPFFPGAAAVPGGQVWAAGQIGLSSVYLPTPLIERWNGKQWEVAYGFAPQHPNLQTTEAGLRAVIALDARDAWAVGSSGTDTLVYHWDGQSWQQVNAPALLYGSWLNAISAVSSRDIWAVGGTGTRRDDSGSLTLVEHWDGKSWQTVPSLNPGTPAPPPESG